MGGHAANFKLATNQPLLHTVPAGNLVEEDFLCVVQTHREKLARGGPLHAERRTGKTGQRGHVLTRSRFPNAGGVVETSSGDPFTVRAERHIENPFTMSAKSA